MALLPNLIAAMIFAITVGAGTIRLWRSHRAAWQARMRHYDNFAETVGGLVLCCDGSGRVTLVSANCEALFGLPPNELMGRGFFERVQVADRPAFLKTISDARARSAPVHATLRWRSSEWRRRGDYAEPVFLWLEMRARHGGDFRAPDEGTMSPDAVAVFRDVTEAKRREAEIEDARAAAVEANLGKDYFLAHAGHELRTPLNTIIGFSELLGDPRLAPPDFAKQREYAKVIHQSGLHLLSVVNSILNMSKIQSGSLAIELEAFAVAPLIDLCCDMVKLQAKNSRVELLRACPETLDEMTGDKRVCTQILINLLSNAIKFTPPNGSVTISARQEPHFLLIRVTDTGIGIAERDLPHLGNPFFQAKALPDRQDRGTGLGLSIVRGLVGLQGGSIVVASEPDKGTCVHVRLPLDGRGLTATVGAPAKIETIARLPVQEQRDLTQSMTVQKIA
ncbi:MAG TPA: PAS domain-containing sensor histidine kinase [Methylocella sp.]|nr:PAS domain-containing sensor histidine kinase [Methylocella sp.]